MPSGFLSIFFFIILWNLSYGSETKSSCIKIEYFLFSGIIIKSYNHYFYGVPALASVDIRFFYFENNKLVKVDEGERAVDYRVKIDKTSN